MNGINHANVTYTLVEPLSGTFLKTLPSLVTALRKVTLRKHETHPPRFKKKGSSVSIQTTGFICAGVSFVGGCKWHALFYLISL